MVELKKTIKKINSFLNNFKNNKVINRIVNKVKNKKNKKNKEKDNTRNTSVAVDIGSSSIKVVQISKINGVSVLDTFGEIALGPFVNKPIGYPVKLDPKTLAHALDIILDESSADSTDVSYCISPNQSFFYYSKINRKENKKKASEYITNEIKEKFKININNYDIDYFEVPNKDEEKKIEKYKVIGFKKEIIKYNKNLSKTLGLKMKLEEMEGNSILYAIKHFFPKDYLIIDIGSSSTKIYIFNQDEIYDYKVIKIGVHHIIKDFNINKYYDVEDGKRNKFIGGSINALFSGEILKEIKNKKESKSLDSVISEIYSFLKDFEIKEKKFISDIMLTGGGAVFAGLEEYLSKKLKRDICIADPFSKVKNPSFVTEKLKEVGPEYAAAIGLALKSINK